LELPVDDVHRADLPLNRGERDDRGECREGKDLFLDLRSKAQEAQDLC